MPFPVKDIHFALVSLTQNENVELLEMKYEIENTEEGILNGHSYEYKLYDLDMEIYICENSFGINIIFNDQDYRFCSINDIVEAIGVSLETKTKNAKDLIEFLNKLNELIDKDILNKTNILKVLDITNA